MCVADAGPMTVNAISWALVFLIHTVTGSDDGSRCPRNPSQSPTISIPKGPQVCVSFSVEATEGIVTVILSRTHTMKKKTIHVSELEMRCDCEVIKSPLLNLYVVYV